MIPLLSQHETADFWNSQGVAADAAGDPVAAAECYRRAVRLRAEWHPVWTNLANALLHSGDAAGAIDAAQQAIRLSSRYAPAHNALGSALLELRDVPGAIGALREAVRVDPELPDAHANLGSALLSQGDLMEGFRQREWRRKIEPIHRREGKPWAPSTSSGRDGGDPFGHTILLYGEGGLGNTIQFARYAPLVADMGARVLIECRRELVPLLKTIRGVWRVIAHDESPEARQDLGWDLHCPLASVPAVLGTTLDTIPAEVPYLPIANRRGAAGTRGRGEGAEAACLSPRHRVSASPRPPLRVGVCWRGAQSGVWRRSRSFDPMHLLPLARIPGVQLFNLQHGVDPPAELTLVGLPELEPQRMTLEKVAEAMLELDLVITCDTSIAHLAGALGVPVWVALKHAPCWRWMMDREDSPWYPTMRLFRQDRPGEWGPVFGRMAQLLAGLFAHSAAVAKI